MSGWVGPVIAIALVVIAVVYVVAAFVALKAIQTTVEQGKMVGKELAELRQELSPALASLNRLGSHGAEIVDLARGEVGELVATSRHLREDLECGMQRARERLADFEAVVEVVQEEVEDAALDFTAALRTVRTGTGVIGRLRRMILPRRRGRS